MKKKEIIIISILLVIQTGIYILCGINKSYIHMDEAYSLGLASYQRTEIQENEDFYNTWHESNYYDDYLSVQEEETGKYSQVYENQKNDVHPPFYYLLLRFAMGFTKGQYSKWSGIVINIIIYLGITILMYAIAKKLLKDQKYGMEKASVIAFLSSITIASLTNVIYIRMYALSTFNILLTTYLHIRLLETKKPSIKLLIGMGMSALIGSLTHYYYLFYLAMLYLIFTVKYVQQKEYKTWIYYTITMGMAGILSLIIFPYSIQHMFFGYRGQGVLSKLTDMSQFLMNISAYLGIVHYFVFHNLLLLILIAMVILNHCRKKKGIEKEEPTEIFKLIVWPTTFYFVLVAIASPWIELRYIMPICSLLFLLVMVYLYQFISKLWKEKEANIIMSLLLVIVMLAPIMYKIEPQVMYSDKKEIVQKLEKERNVPTIYLFQSSHNRFLDDILLFAKIKESYIAKDLDCTQENIQNIFKGKDTSNGIVVFINEGQDKNEKLEIVQKAMNLKKAEHLKRLNACDVYYLKNQ